MSMTHSAAPTPHRPLPLSLVAGDVLTTTAAAELLACHPRTVTALIMGGQLRAFRLGKGRTAWRIWTADLLAFVGQHGTPDLEK